MYKPTTLGYAILGLLLQPMTGYGIRKVFESTPMGEYSSSPGSIYPALNRLRKESLIEQFDKSSSRKKLYRLTNSGKNELKNWCKRPVSLSEVQNKMNELMLRFVFMEYFVDTDATIKFLNSIKKNIDLYIKELRMYFDENESTMPFHSSLAMEQGIEMICANMRWTDYAIDAVTKKNQTNSVKQD